MDAKETFLLSLPSALDVEQCMVLEAIGYSADLIGLAYLRLKRGAARCLASRDHGESEKPETAPLFLDAWSIVDHAHMLRQLLGRTTKFIERLEIEQAIEALAVATQGRNKMDHLHQNVVNLSNKAELLPIYGALSFGVVTEAALDGTVKKLKIVSITAGISHTAQSSLRLINPIGKNFEGPIDFFQLEAFGLRMDLSSLATRSKRVLDLFNTEIGDEVRRQIEAKAIEAGLDVKAALEPKVSGMFAELTLNARSPDPGS